MLSSCLNYHTNSVESIARGETSNLFSNRGIQNFTIHICFEAVPNSILWRARTLLERRKTSFLFFALFLQLFVFCCQFNWLTWAEPKQMPLAKCHWSFRNSCLRNDFLLHVWLMLLSLWFHFYARDFLINIFVLIHSGAIASLLVVLFTEHARFAAEQKNEIWVVQRRPSRLLSPASFYFIPRD